MENQETNLVRRINKALETAERVGLIYTQDKVAEGLTTNKFVIGNIVGTKNYELINHIALNRIAED